MLVFTILLALFGFGFGVLVVRFCVQRNINRSKVAVLEDKLRSAEEARQILRNQLSTALAERDAARRLVAACEDAANREKRATGLLKQLAAIYDIGQEKKK